jgi:hypothetical protein
MNLEQMHATGKVLKASNGEIRLCCPYCEHVRLDKSLNQRKDTKYHLYINVEKDVFNCYRCGTRGKASKLFPFIEMYKFTSVTTGDLRHLLSAVDTKGTSLHVFNINEISYPVTSGLQAYEYLTRYRGFSPEVVKHYDMRVGLNRLEGRVVVPFYNTARKCIYYSARSYTSTLPKYLNPKENKSNVIFNVDFVPPEETPIICEGVFSAIAAGKTAIALLGKFLSITQLHIIARKFKSVLLALDGDVGMEQKLTYQQKFLDLGISCGIVPLPREHDPESIGKDKFRELVSCATILSNNNVRSKIIQKFQAESKLYRNP